MVRATSYENDEIARTHLTPRGLSHYGRLPNRGLAGLLSRSVHRTAYGPLEKAVTADLDQPAHAAAQAPVLEEQESNRCPQ